MKPYQYVPSVIDVRPEGKKWWRGFHAGWSAAQGKYPLAVPKIWWCESHQANQAYLGAGYCWFAHYEAHREPCRMILSLIVEAPREEA